MFPAGAVCLVAAAPVFLVANLVVGLAWQNPSFDWSHHNISDLGNVTCGVWDVATRPRHICSPWHDAMNAAFVLTGLLLIAGLVLTWRTWGRGLTIRAAHSLMLLGAAGLGLAGVFPGDVHPRLHMVAALLVFGCGNGGLALLGLAPRAALTPGRRTATLTTGFLGLAGTVLFFAEEGLGLGVGGMERIAVLPLTVWCCFAGSILLFERRSSHDTVRR